MARKKTAKKNKKNTPIVTKKFLMNLADDIYDRKTRKYMRLCSGTLRNGEDPLEPGKVMHCGLGELYVAMTGEEIEVTKHYDPWGYADDRLSVSEDEIIQMAIDKSTLVADRDIRRKKAQEAFEKLGFKGVDLDGFMDRLDDSVVDAFAERLGLIPDENDVVACGTRDEYRKRACRVARVLREAAEILPR